MPHSHLKIEDILVCDNTCLELYFLKGFAKYRDKKYQEPLALFTEVQEKDPNYFFIELQIANCFYKLKEESKARVIYKKQCKHEIKNKYIQQLLRVSITLLLRQQFPNESLKRNSIFEEKSQQYCGKRISEPQLFDLDIPHLGRTSKLVSCKSENFRQFFIQYRGAQIITKFLITLKEFDKSIKIYDKVLQSNPKNILALIGSSFEKSRFQLKQLKQMKRNLIQSFKMVSFYNIINVLIRQLEQQFEIEEPHSILGFTFVRVLTQTNIYFLNNNNYENSHRIISSVKIQSSLYLILNSFGLKWQIFVNPSLFLFIYDLEQQFF